MLQNPEDILPDESQPVWQHHEIWPALLLLALILFFLDIALRKLGLRFVKEKLFGPSIRKLTGALAHLKSSNQQVGKKPIDENESIISESYSTVTDEKYDEKRNESSKGKQKSSQKEEQADFTSALLEARRKSRIRK